MGAGRRSRDLHRLDGATIAGTGLLVAYRDASLNRVAAAAAAAAAAAVSWRHRREICVPTSSYQTPSDGGGARHEVMYR